MSAESDAHTTIQWRIDFTTESPQALELSWALQALETATVAGAWIDLALAGEDSVVARALRSAGTQERARERFYPNFADRTPGGIVEVIDGLDPFEPLDIGLLVGLNSWLRNELAGDADAYQAMFDLTPIERIGNESPLVVVVILIPPAIKGVGIAAAGIGAVGKGVHKYYKVKKSRNEAKRAAEEAEATRQKAEADVKKAAAETAVAEARAQEIRRRGEAEAKRIEAETELLRARTEEIRGRNTAVPAPARAQLADQDLRGEIAAELEDKVKGVDAGSLERAAQLGAVAGEIAIGQLEANPAVAGVSVEVGGGG
jgi:hypothetical protein